MAEGDIGAVIDSLTFDGVAASRCRIIHVAGAVFAIAYAGPDADGFLCTVTIGDDGAISDAVIDTLEFDGAQGVAPSIIHVAGAVFAIAYNGPDTDGWVCTVSINADGTIDDAVIDTLEYDAYQALEPKIIHLGGQAYAVADRGNNYAEIIYSFTITDAGLISDAILDTLIVKAPTVYEGHLIQVNNSVCAIVLQDSDLDGWLITVPCNSQGAIGDAIIASLEFAPVQAYTPFIIHISGNVFAIVGSTYNGAGTIYTVTIYPAGTLDAAVIDSYAFTSAQKQGINFMHISGTVYALVYSDTGNDLWVKTLSIGIDGTITEAIIDSLELDEADGLNPGLIHVTGNIYAVAYTGTTSVGKLKTFDIDTVPAGFQKHLMLMGID